MSRRHATTFGWTAAARGSRACSCAAVIACDHEGAETAAKAATATARHCAAEGMKREVMRCARCRKRARSIGAGLSAAGRDNGCMSNTPLFSVLLTVVETLATLAFALS